MTGKFDGLNYLVKTWTGLYSKEELRQKRKMAINISRLMFEEEQKLKKGQSLSSMGELDKMLLGSHGGLVTRQPNQGETYFLIYFWHYFLLLQVTLTKTEIVYPKNVRVKVAMDFTLKINILHPGQLKK